MKKLTVFAALMPTAVLSHGAHAPAADAVHGAVHSGLNTGLAIIAVALVAGVIRRFRS